VNGFGFGDREKNERREFQDTTQHTSGVVAVADNG